MSVIARLPLELLREIMKHHAAGALFPADSGWGMSPALQSVINVSRGWRDVAYTTAEYWRDIVLTERTVDAAYLWAKRGLHRDLRVNVQYSIEALLSDGPAPDLDNVFLCLEHLAPHCTALAVMGHDHRLFYWLTQPEVLSWFSSLRVLSLKSRPSKYEHEDNWINPAPLSSLPMLSVLHVEYTQAFVAPPLAITSLQISRGPAFHSVPAQQFADVLQSMTQLESLYIQGSGWFWNARHNWDVAELDLPRLVCLELQRLSDSVREDDDFELRAFLNSLRAPALQRLRLNGIREYTTTDLAIHLDNISSKCPNLEKLFLGFPYGDREDLVAILYKFSSITELVIWNPSPTLLEDRLNIGNIYGDRLLPNLTMLRLMDCQLEFMDLGRFLQRRAARNLSCPTIECWEVRDAGIAMDIASIRCSVTSLAEPLRRPRRDIPLEGDTYIILDIAQITDWLGKVQIFLTPDVSQWLEDEFIRFAPERLQSSWRLLHHEARRGLRKPGFWPWASGGEGEITDL